MGEQKSVHGQQLSKRLPLLTTTRPFILIEQNPWIRSSLAASPRGWSVKLTKKQKINLGPVIVMILDLVQDLLVVIDPKKFIQSAFEMDFRFTESIQ
jgi:hypothetical protein